MKKFKLSLLFLFSSYIISYFMSNGFSQKLKWVAVLLFFVVVLINLKKGIPKELLHKIPFWTHLLIFNILGIITTYYSNNFNSSLFTLIGLNIYFFIFYFSSHQIVSRENGILLFNNIVIVSSILFTTCAFLIDLPLTLSQFSSYYYGRIRIYGSFQYPNYLGGICFVTLIACFINLKLSSKHKKKYLIAFLIFLIYLFASDSRGALYSFIIFLFTYYFIKLYRSVKNKLFKVSLVLFGMSLLIIIFYIINGAIGSFLGNDDLLNSITSGRINNWEFLLDNMILNNNKYLLFGHGLSSVTNLVEIGLNTDNGYIVWLYEAGLLNLLTILSLLFYLLFSGIRNNLNIITLPIFLSYIIYVYFENFLMNFGHVVSLYCWIHLFIGFHLSNHKNVLSKS